MVVVVTYIRWRKGVKLPRLKMSPTIGSRSAATRDGGMACPGYLDFYVSTLACRLESAQHHVLPKAAGLGFLFRSNTFGLNYPLWCRSLSRNHNIQVQLTV
jgi:hypothetical protein